MIGKHHDILSFFQRVAAENIEVSSMVPAVLARELKSKNKKALVAGWGKTNNKRESGKNQAVSN